MNNALDKPENSALRNHFLASILPKGQIEPPKQFLKNREFYKPEQFIWNNPHRTSRKIYPYYHKDNEEYEKYLKPYHMHLEQQDRINLEKEKISKLTQMREEARTKFFSKKRERVQLEAKADSRKKISESESSEKPKRAYSLKNNLQTYRGEPLNYKYSIPEQTFMKSLQKYDANISEIRKLVSNQISQNHDKIRENFQRKRSENNQRYSLQT